MDCTRAHSASCTPGNCEWKSCSNFVDLLAIFSSELTAGPPGRRQAHWLCRPEPPPLLSRSPRSRQTPERHGYWPSCWPDICKLKCDMPLKERRPDSQRVLTLAARSPQDHKPRAARTGLLTCWFGACGLQCTWARPRPERLVPMAGCAIRPCQ